MSYSKLYGVGPPSSILYLQKKKKNSKQKESKKKKMILKLYLIKIKKDTINSIIHCTLGLLLLYRR